MCGIFGIALRSASSHDVARLAPAVTRLFELSESRGKESAGLAVHSGSEITVYKQPIAASEFTSSRAYRELFTDLATGLARRSPATPRPVAIIGHSRLVTNGREDDNLNNQPVITSGMVGIHNGIIVNDAALWAAFPDLERHSDVDTEVLLTLLRRFLDQTGSLAEACRRAFEVIRGSASIATYVDDVTTLLLATNTGSLYVCRDTATGAIAFASERYILEEWLKLATLSELGPQTAIHQLPASHACLVDLGTHESQQCLLDGIDLSGAPSVKTGTHIPVRLKDPGTAASPAKTAPRATRNEGAAARLATRPLPLEGVTMRRCSRCVLPETMPFITFDGAGVCNYCHAYRKVELKGERELDAQVDRYRSKTGAPDCIVTLSGGRDSCYGLHYVKKVLKLNPIAYSYDWGMLTDLARRNQARMCGKLGVEHIVVSADIRRKRHYIGENVRAWMRRPDLGIIPLFMAGDKQYFYHAEVLRRRTGIPVVVLCENPLERTNFKSGFCGVRPSPDAAKTRRLSLEARLRMIGYYGYQFLTNPAYLNRSLIDTATAYLSYYVMPHNFLSLFHYVPWVEEDVERTLIGEYEWELATDTTSSWRIGDGTTAFYNYVYLKIAGFTEHDTFRSNQVREGLLDRERALELVRVGNMPRYESMQWYCDTVGLDLDEVLRVVDAQPKLYHGRN